MLLEGRKHISGDLVPSFSTILSLCLRGVIFFRCRHVVRPKSSADLCHAQMIIRELFCFLLPMPRALKVIVGGGILLLNGAPHNLTIFVSNW